jgi:EAL domain-containing protein (putative c-di-GMP-specific phosphodiesterase class I)
VRLRRDDIVCRTEDGDAYLCFLAPSRTAHEPLHSDLEQVALRVEEVLRDGLGREISHLMRERPRVIVGHARVLNNPMMRAERLIARLVGEARGSAELARQRAVHRDRALLQEIILQDRLTPVYQPIVHLASGDIFGYESLARGPRNSPLQAPGALFSIADEVSLTFELDRACFRGALRAAVGLEPIHRLFVNLLPQSFYDGAFIDREINGLLEEAALTPANVVFEITEKLAIENFGAFRRALASYTSMGFGVAIDDVGTRHSNLESVMALRPHFIKISDVLTRGVSRSTVKREMLRSLGRIAATVDAVVVAEGIETPDDLSVLSELGVRYGQGFYLARPGPPFVKLRPSVRSAIRLLWSRGVAGEVPPPRVADDDGDGFESDSFDDRFPRPDAEEGDITSYLPLTAADGELASDDDAPLRPNGTAPEVLHLPREPRSAAANAAAISAAGSSTRLAAAEDDLPSDLAQDEPHDEFSEATRPRDDHGNRLTWRPIGVDELGGDPVQETPVSLLQSLRQPVAAVTTGPEPAEAGDESPG